MSSTAFYVLLMIGALVIAPLARLIPTGRDPMIFPMAILVAVVFSLAIGSVVASETGAHTVTTLLATLASVPLYIVAFHRFGSGQASSSYHSPDAGGWDSDCGDSSSCD